MLFSKKTSSHIKIIDDEAINTNNNKHIPDYTWVNKDYSDAVKKDQGS